jgi:uncharacterized protein
MQSAPILVSTEGGRVRLKIFVLLTVCGFVVFAFTMTFVPVLPRWAHYAGMVVLIVLFFTFWRMACSEHPWRRLGSVFFAYFTAMIAVSLGFFFGDWGLFLFGLTTQTPAGIAVAKCSQASVIVIALLVTVMLSGERFASLYLRKGRLLFGLSVGLMAAAVCLLLALQQPGIRSLGASRLLSLTPWILLFIISNAFMEELLFRGLFLGRYEALVGRWPAILSTALAFTLAHMQVRYAPDIIVFMMVLLGLSIVWGWLMHKSNSLWGSVVFHAGADLLIILPIFKELGAI